MLLPPRPQPLKFAAPFDAALRPDIRREASRALSLSRWKWEAEVNEVEPNWQRLVGHAAVRDNVSRWHCEQGIQPEDQDVTCAPPTTSLRRVQSIANFQSFLPLICTSVTEDKERLIVVKVTEVDSGGDSDRNGDLDDTSSDYGDGISSEGDDENEHIQVLFIKTPIDARRDEEEKTIFR